MSTQATELRKHIAFLKVDHNHMDAQQQRTTLSTSNGQSKNIIKILEKKIE